MKYRLIKIAISTVLGFIVTVALGWLFFGNQLFVYKSPAFQFILFGAICPLLISTVKLTDLKVYRYLSAIVILLIPLTSDSIQNMQLKLVVRDLVFGIFLTFSIFMAFRLYRSFAIFTRMLNEFALWTFAVVISYMTASIILLILFKHPHVIQYLLFQLQYAFMIGIGVSGGIIAGNSITIKDPNQT